ncbi:MAG: AtpZ/AtpI family protein [Alphaproteobacteria bacterium]
MEEGGSPPSLKDIEDRLRQARAEKPGDGRKAEPSAVGQAFRIAAELVSGLLVGLAIGWLLDRWLGTGPWLLILFFFLGAAAGILNVYRAARGYGLAVGYKKRDRATDEDEEELN